MSETLYPIFVVSCFNFLSQPGHAHSRDLIDFAGLHRHGRKPWVPSTCAGDLRELLRVPLRSQGYCEVGRGVSGLHWIWCNGRGPRLELRQEPQGSSPFLTGRSGTPLRQIRGIDPPIEISMVEGTQMKWCWEPRFSSQARPVCRGTFSVALRVPSTLLTFKTERGTSLETL